MLLVYPAFIFMARVTLAEVDKKIDLLLQDSKYIKKEQERVAEELIHHTGQDESRFSQLLSAQTTINTEIALIKQSRSGNSSFYGKLATFAAGLLTTVCGVVLGFWLS